MKNNLKIGFKVIYLKCQNNLIKKINASNYLLENLKSNLGTIY